MGNKINRHDPATAIPILEKQINSLNKSQEQIREEIKDIGDSAVPQSMYLVSIYATRGNLLKGGIDSTVLQASLYSWDINITADTPADHFTWTRNSGNVNADAEWNAANGKGKKSITVIKEDVGEQSTFLCTVNDNNKLYAQAQIIVSSNYVLEDAVVEIEQIRQAVTNAETSAREAKEAAQEAQTKADSAVSQMDAVNAEINAANQEVETLKGDLTTLGETLEADYATKGELTNIDTSLKAEIQKNAGQISSVVTRVDDIKIDADKAIADAQAAAQAAQTAQDKADTAQRNYEILKQQADATDAELTQAKQDVESAQAAAQAAQNAADIAQAAADSLTDRVTTAETNITQNSEQIQSIAIRTTVLEEESATKDEFAQQLEEKATQILQTSEEVTIGILSGYTTTEDLERYKSQIENTFKANEEGFAFEFEQMQVQLDELGGEIATRNQFIRLVNGEIIIGKSDSPITSVYTSNGMEIRYNGEMIARYTNEVLEVRNVSVDNQVSFFDEWAIRKGAYTAGVGNNLNDMWIGG